MATDLFGNPRRLTIIEEFEEWAPTCSYGPLDLKLFCNGMLGEDSPRRYLNIETQKAYMAWVESHAMLRDKIFNIMA